jgi:hypothetical protein
LSSEPFVIMYLIQNSSFCIDICIQSPPKCLQQFFYKRRPSAVALSQYSHNSSKKDLTKSQNRQVKMKFLVVFALCIVAALAAPAEDVQILKNDFENIGVDGYKFAYVEFRDSEVK